MPRNPGLPFGTSSILGPGFSLSHFGGQLAWGQMWGVTQGGSCPRCLLFGGHPKSLFSAGGSWERGARPGARGRWVRLELRADSGRGTGTGSGDGAHGTRAGSHRCRRVGMWLWTGWGQWGGPWPGPCFSPICPRHRDTCLCGEEGSLTRACAQRARGPQAGPSPASPPERPQQLRLRHAGNGHGGGPQPLHSAS